MKGFSRQLLIKHNFLEKAQFSDDEEGFSLEDAAKSLEADLELFLQVVSFQPRSIKVGRGRRLQDSSKRLCEFL